MAVNCISYKALHKLYGNSAASMSLTVTGLSPGHSGLHHGPCHTSPLNTLYLSSTVRIGVGTSQSFGHPSSLSSARVPPEFRLSRPVGLTVNVTGTKLPAAHRCSRLGLLQRAWCPLAPPQSSSSLLRRLESLLRVGDNMGTILVPWGQTRDNFTKFPYI